MQEKQKSIGGLWSKTSKTGNKFMSGNIEIDGKKHKFVVFENKYKREDKHPDYQIYQGRDNEPKKEIPVNHADIPEDDIPYWYKKFLEMLKKHGIVEK